MRALLSGVGLAALLVGACGCGSSSSGMCYGGCLCFTTPDTCPSGCTPTTVRHPDASAVFVCDNVLPDAMVPGSSDATADGG